MKLPDGLNRTKIAAGQGRERVVSGPKKQKAEEKRAQGEKGEEEEARRLQRSSHEVGQK